MTHKQQFKKDLLAELKLIRSKYKKLTSFHEAYGLLLEELDEFWEEVKKKPRKRDLNNVSRELIQIAALATIFHEDLVQSSLDTVSV